MTEEKRNSYFKDLTTKEKVSKLHNLVKAKGVLTLWIKGAKVRTNFRSHYFDKNELRVYLDKKETDLAGKTVLYAFQFQNVSFFGTGDLSLDEKKELVLHCNGDSYKVERRSTFRLLTYPAHKVYLYIRLKGFAAQSNLIDFKTGSSQTGLFNTFLDMLDGEDGDGLTEGAIQFRVHDISVSGISFQAGRTETQFFEEGGQILNMTLKFGIDTVIIPKAEVVYIVNTINPPTNVFKIGVKFIDLPEDADGKISYNINSLIRLSDHEEFEGLIK